MEKLTKLECLFIRAIKTNKVGRVNKLYKKFYYASGSEIADMYHMSIILMEISSKIKCITVNHLVHDLNPERRWHYISDKDDKKYTEVEKYYLQLFGIFRHAIMFTEANKLIKFGYVRPAKWRNK